MPWKGEKDPYKIWLSEIILQQTRVEQGLNYYNRFVKAFPDINKLAKANDNKVMKMWEGLGYYSRCRNLLASARHISVACKGVFPSTFDEIKSLKGVGPYTAAAIASFAFKLPHAVVDGNVYRVLSRIFGIKTPVDSTAGKKYFSELANDLLDRKQPGIYNQAIMDFGAVVCKPVSPVCGECSLKNQCIAFKSNCISALPVKEKKIVVRSRWLYYIVPTHKNEYFITRRTGKDIWHQLNEFILLEQPKKLNAGEIQNLISRFHPGLKFKKIEGPYNQLLSHQRITACFVRIDFKQKPRWLQQGQWVNKKQLNQFAFPGVIRDFLQTLY